MDRFEIYRYRRSTLDSQIPSIDGFRGTFSTRACRERYDRSTFDATPKKRTNQPVNHEICRRFASSARRYNCLCTKRGACSRAHGFGGILGEGECAWCVMIYEYEHDEQAQLTRRYRSYLTNTAVPPIAPLIIILLRRRSTAADLPPSLIWTSSVSSLFYVCVDHISLSLSFSLSLHPSNLLKTSHILQSIKTGETQQAILRARRGANGHNKEHLHHKYENGGPKFFTVKESKPMLHNNPALDAPGHAHADVNVGGEHQQKQKFKFFWEK